MLTSCLHDGSCHHLFGRCWRRSAGSPLPPLPPHTLQLANARRVDEVTLGFLWPREGSQGKPLTMFSGGVASHHCGLQSSPLSYLCWFVGFNFFLCPVLFKLEHTHEASEKHKQVEGQERVGTGGVAVFIQHNQYSLIKPGEFTVHIVSTVKAPGHFIAPIFRLSISYLIS